MTASLPRVDDALLRRLYAEHAGALLGYVRSLLRGDLGRAEDVVQETLLRAWQRPEALAQGRTRAWLWTVARNLVIDGERARRARPREVGAEGVDRAASSDEIDAMLTATAVADALETLSPEHRGVVELLYLGQRSVAEVAEQLGIPPGTVKSRAYYGLRALRLACEERGLLP